MAKHKIKTVIEQLQSFKRLGYEADSFSTRIGKAPHIAEFAWLHALYEPLSADQLIDLVEELGGEMPKDYQDFLKVTNGLTIFTGSISLYGKRNSFARDTDSAWKYPFDILTPNVKEKSSDMPNNFFVIGGYRKDGSKVAMLKENSEIVRIDRDDYRILNRWDNLTDFLEAEVNRMISQFNDDGTLKNETSKNPTTKGGGLPPTPDI